MENPGIFVTVGAQVIALAFAMANSPATKNKNHCISGANAQAKSQDGS